MALGDALNCLQLAARRNAGAVFLTGGEPTLHPGLLSCIEKSVSLGLYTVVASNGSFKLESLEGMKQAGLQELHVCYDKYHAPFIKSDRVKQIIDKAVALGIRPVLILIEANSYYKYLDVLGDYYRFCIPGETFKPIVYVGRAIHLPKAEFESDASLPVSKIHGFSVFVLPSGRVSFCPVNPSLPSTVVDLASDWLDGVVETFRQDPTVKILLSEGLGGILRRCTGIASEDWSSPFYECNLCIQSTHGGAMTIGKADPRGKLALMSEGNNA
jgi:hypothetical protein